MDAEVWAAASSNAEDACGASKTGGMTSHAAAAIGHSFGLPFGGLSSGSIQQQQFSGRLAALQVAMGLGRVLEGIRVLDAKF